MQDRFLVWDRLAIRITSYNVCYTKLLRVIAGQDAAATIESLNGYKAGTLDKYGMGGLMKGQVAALSDDSYNFV